MRKQAEWTPGMFVVDYEMGRLTPREKAEGFQRLIDQGLLPYLDEKYQREATFLIRNGLCRPREEVVVHGV